MVEDLSVGGCRLASPSAPSLSPETMIELQLRPRQSPSIFVPRAIVRWTSQSSFGVQFHALTEPESTRLTRLLGSLTA
jgi:hypothetical protein